MRTGEFHKSRGIANASFRRRFSRVESRPIVEPTPASGEGTPKISSERYGRVTRTVANILEAIGAIGFCGALYLFFRDKALALRTLIGSSISAGVGVLMNLAITITRKLRGPRKTA